MIVVFLDSLSKTDLKSDSQSILVPTRSESSTVVTNHREEKDTAET